MTQGSYKQFCPVAMAAETLCNRWTILVLRELSCGSTRFNDLRRGLPRMSPALLSKRLRELEKEGIVLRVAGPGGATEYHLTRAGRELEPVIKAIGMWGQRWVEARPSLENLDPDLLMWDMRRCINCKALPKGRSVAEFIFPEQPQKHRHYWLVMAPDAEVEVCFVDPGYDVDLYATTDLRTITAIWMGLDTVGNARKRGELVLTGKRQLADAMQTWLGLSAFASERKLVSA
jgi:DNA-binding HxlR family transcriptional regulator